MTVKRPAPGELEPIETASRDELQALQLKRLRATLQIQRDFIADAAHQLRSPLAGMALHVDQALAHGDPDTVREALQHAALEDVAARVVQHLEGAANVRLGQLGHLAIADGLVPLLARRRVHERSHARLVQQVLPGAAVDAQARGLGYVGRGSRVHVPGRAVAGGLLQA